MLKRIEHHCRYCDKLIVVNYKYDFTIYFIVKTITSNISEFLHYLFKHKKFDKNIVINILFALLFLVIYLLVAFGLFKAIMFLGKVIFG